MHDHNVKVGFENTLKVEEINDLPEKKPTEICIMPRKH